MATKSEATDVTSSTSDRLPNKSNDKHDVDFTAFIPDNAHILRRMSSDERGALMKSEFSRTVVTDSDIRFAPTKAQPQPDQAPNGSHPKARERPTDAAAGVAPPATDEAAPKPLSWDNPNARLMYFGELGTHTAARADIEMAKYFTKLKDEMGVKYMGFEFLPEDFKKSELTDHREDLIKHLAETAPLAEPGASYAERSRRAEEYLKMVDAAAKAGLEPVGFEKSTINGDRIGAKLHELLTSKEGRDVFEKWTKAEKGDTEAGKTLEKFLGQLPPLKNDPDASKLVKELEMMKDTGFRFGDLLAGLDKAKESDTKRAEIIGIFSTDAEGREALAKFDAADPHNNAAEAEALRKALLLHVSPEKADTLLADASELKEGGLSFSHPDDGFKSLFDNLYSVDWRDRTWAEKIAPLVDQGKMAVFAGAGHFMTKFDPEAGKQPWHDYFGIAPRSMWSYLHELRPDLAFPTYALGLARVLDKGALP